MRTRSARAGFFALAGIAGLDLARSIYVDGVLARLRSGANIDGLANQLDVLDDLWIGLWLLGVVAAFVAGSIPASVRARRLVIGIGLAWLLQVAIHATQLMLGRSMLSGSGADMEAFKRMYEICWTSIELAALGGAISSAIAFLRIGRAANHPRAKAIAIGTTVPTMIAAVPSAILAARMDAGVSQTAQTIVTWYGHAAWLVYAVGLAWAGRQVARLPYDDVVEEAPGSVNVGPEWNRVAAGIYAYLLAALVRVLIGLFTFATVRGAGSAVDSYPEMHRLHDEILTLGYIGGGASLVMIAAGVMIARGPSANVRRPAVGVLVCLVLGLVLDAGTTSMTANAMTSVSAAFDAMDLLPALAAVGTALSTVAGWLLLRTMTAAATELALAGDAKRARFAGQVVVVAGAAGAVAQLAIKALPAELVLVLAVVVVPAILFAVVQLVRVMLSVATTIQEKAAPRR